MSALPGSLADETRKLQRELTDYQPGKASKSPDRIKFSENLYIGLFGKTCCGKTSLINSIKYAADRRLRLTKWEQVAPQDMAGGQTMYRKLANITDHICVIDNRGLDEPNTEQAIEELTAQLDGKRSYDEIVDWQKVDEGADDDLHLGKGDAEGLHPISRAVFVFNEQHDIEDNTNGLVDIIDYLHIHQGRYPLAVITHVDVADEAWVENLCTVLRTIGVSDIFKVADLTSAKTRLEEYYQLLLLNFMNKCMVEGDETLIFKYDERKWRELMLRHEMMISECARAGAQLHELRDSFEALEREGMAALKRERVAVLERERSEAQGREREAALEREWIVALERERVVALERKRVVALERERVVALEREKVAVLERESSEALERERSEAQERERMAALEQEKVAVLERERSEALVRERMTALERERSEAQGREREAALEREKMAALKRERMAVQERERSETQGREREAALEATIMRMKRDMPIMVTAERERQASSEDSKKGTKMPFNPKRETSPSYPPSRTSSIECGSSYDDDVKWDDDSNSSTDDKSDTTLPNTDKVDCTTLVLKPEGRTTTTMHSSFGHMLFAIILFLVVQRSMSENQFVIALQGDTATLRFNTSWPSTSFPDAIPYFTLRFYSTKRPFFVDGKIDPNALLHSSQYGRFTVVQQRNSGDLVVNLIIQDVNSHDVGSYVLSFHLLRSHGEFDTTKEISLKMTVTPGKAKCVIMKSDSGILWHEAHCNANAGSGNRTVSCFQDHNKVPYKGEVVRNGDMIRGIFWMISSNPMHCCSHEWKESITQNSCLDFVFLSQPKLTTATFDTPKSSEASATKDRWGRMSTEYIQVEPPAERSFASRAYQTVTPCIILASLILYSQR